MSTSMRLLILIALLGVCCLALAYRVFDQGITITYLNAGQESSNSHVKLLTGLVEREWLGLPEEQVMLRLKTLVALQPADSIVLKRESETGAILFEGIRFEFRAGKLARVTSGDLKESSRSMP